VTRFGALTVIEADPAVVEVVRGIWALSALGSITADAGTDITPGFDDDNVRLRAASSSAGVEPITVVTTRALYVWPFAGRVFGTAERFSPVGGFDR
jgi:hypothetical protein